MYNIQDLQALRQVMKSFEQEFYVRRKIARKYNEMGRLENEAVRQKVIGNMQPTSKKVDLENNGMGQLVSATYTLNLIYPEYVQTGDILETPYGLLKVDSVSDFSIYGTMSAELTRLGSTDYMKSEKDYVRSGL